MITHNEINESIGTVKKRIYLFHCTDHTALKCFNKLQSQCAKNSSDRFSCSDQSHCSEIREVFLLQVNKTSTEVSYFYYRHAYVCV